MSTNIQPQPHTALIPPTTVRYQIVWQETSTGHLEHSEGEIIITTTDITIIADGSRAPGPRYMAVAKLTWGLWEANFGCTYYAFPSIFLDFELLRMNDAMRQEVEGRCLGNKKGRNNRWVNSELKICTAAPDDGSHWMLRVEVEGNGLTEDMSNHEQTGGVKLWAKRVVRDEGMRLSGAEKNRLQIDCESSQDNPGF